MRVLKYMIVRWRDMRWLRESVLGALILGGLASGCQDENVPRQVPPTIHAASAETVRPQPQLPKLSLAREALLGEKASRGKLVGATLDGQPALVLADEDDYSLRIFAKSGLRLMHTLPLECAPRSVLLDEAGDVLVLSRSCSQLQRLELRGETAQVVASVALPAEPVDMVAQAKHLYVVSDWGSAISKLDRATLAVEKTRPLPRSPQAIMPSDDGATLFVAHAAGSLLSTVDSASLDVTEESLGAVRHVSHKVKHLRRHRLRGVDFDLLDVDHPHLRRRVARSTTVQMFATQGFSIVKGAGNVFVPQVLASPMGGGRFATGYGISSDHFPPVIQDVAVFDPSERTSNRAGKTFAIISGWKASDKNTCRLPRAAAYDEVRSTLVVACVGSSRVIEFDALARDPARTEIAEWTVARGPAALHIDSSRRQLYVWSEFERTLSALSLDAEAPPRPTENSSDGLAARRAAVPEGKVFETAHVPLRQHSEHYASAVAELRGRELFHRSLDTRISKDGRACASCHPQGRDDGLSWRAPGTLGSRQTMMLAGRLHDTAPYGWQGEHATLKQHVEHTIVHQLDGTGLPRPELELLVQYIDALPGPTLQSPEDREAVARGRALFLEDGVGCTDCHDETGTVDGAQHQLEAKVRRDTPSLRYVVGTAPYFHDGRYATLSEMLEHSQGTMGQEVPLSDAARADLVAYLRTL